MNQLVRSYLPDRTIGYISIGGLFFSTLERPWNDNQRNVSCIPEGEYQAIRDHAGRHQFYRIKNVPNRSFIEIHNGRIPTHSDGCILIGMQFGVNFDIAVNGAEEFCTAMNDLDFILTIRSFDPKIDKWPRGIL